MIEDKTKFHEKEFIMKIDEFKEMTNLVRNKVEKRRKFIEGLYSDNNEGERLKATATQNLGRIEDSFYQKSFRVKRIQEKIRWLNQLK